MYCAAFRIVGSSLYHGGRPVGQIPGNGVGGAGPQIAAVDMGADLLAAEHHPLGKDRQAAEGGGPVGADDGIGQNAVEERDVDAVVVAVKGHGLYVYVCAHEFRAADPGAGGAVQDPLGAGGQVDGQVLDAVLIPAGIGDFAGVDRHGLPQLVGIAAQGVGALISHEITS